MTRIGFSNFEWGAAAASALLLILSFPNFEFYLLAWIALVPLLVVIARRPAKLRAFILGWAVGSVFFYATCYWLTYSMIHYGGLPAPLAYLLLIPGALVIGIFHGVFAFLIALMIQAWGRMTILFAPLFWASLEWVRLEVTGQLWNALGYSQAFHPSLIRPAAWGGVYAVSFLLVAVNSAIALLIVKRTWLSLGAALMIGFAVWAALVGLSPDSLERPVDFPERNVKVVAVQPNVPMNPVKSTEETNALIERHVALSTQGLAAANGALGTRLVIWPESPMNFTYGTNASLREFIANFARQNHTSVLFNSLEAAPNDGSYNSALLVNEEGRLISQYDKIRLMPFGEYVPLPQWLPGASLISGIVGEFTPGSNYTLMPIGDRKAGVFICIESAYPWIARRLTFNGANVLINISNDGYLGPTAVMRQHLANVIFRAVENGRPVMRVTNTGLSALIDADGRVYDMTEPFKADVRVWTNRPGEARNTIYTSSPDWFVYACGLLGFMILAVTIRFKFLYRKNNIKDGRSINSRITN